MMNTHPNILKFLTASSRGEGVNSELWLITEFYDRVRPYRVLLECRSRLPKTDRPPPAVTYSSMLSVTGSNDVPLMRSQQKCCQFYPERHHFVLCTSEFMTRLSPDIRLCGTLVALHCMFLMLWYGWSRIQGFRNGKKVSRLLFSLYNYIKI